MNMNYIIKVLLTTSILGLFSFNAYAQFEFHPRLSLEEEYTDNLFLADDGNEQEDWITTVEPGITLTYDSRSVDVSVDYSLRYLFYLENDDENIDSFEDVQRATASALFFSGRPFTLNINESITREALDERDVNADFNELVNRSTVYRLQITPEYRLQLTSSFSLVFAYTYDRADYVEDAGNDYEEHRGRFSIVKELSSNTNLSFNTSYAIHESDTDDDFTQQGYTVGLTQQIGSRLSISAEGGYSEVEYDNELIFTDTIWYTSWLLSADYQLSGALSLAISYDQGFDLSATDGLTKNRSAVFGLAYAKDNLTANGELFWQQSDYLALVREDEAIGSRFDVSIPLSRAFFTTFDAEYEYVSFDPEGVEEDHFSFGASLGYEYRRFLSSLAYRYSLSDSDTGGSNYTNNVITLSASVRF